MSQYLEPDPGYQAGYSSSLFPGYQAKSWNRANPYPSLSALNFEFYAATPETVVYYMINHSNTEVDWLKFDDSKVSGQYINATPGTLNVLNLGLQNLELLTGNYYEATITIVVTNYYNQTETLQHTVALSISGAPSIRAEQSNYEVVFNRANNTLSGDTTVNILNNSAPILIDFFQDSNIFAEAEDFTTSFTIADNPVSPIASNATLPITGTKIINAVLKRQDGSSISAFTITLSIIDDGDISAFPESFDFTLQKEEAETKTGVLRITNPISKAFTITHPSWLTLSSTSGSSTQMIDVTTVNSSSLDPGVYEDNIVMSYDSKTITIPVRLNVINFVSINLAGDHNFCLDDVILDIYKMNEAARFVSVNIKAEFITRETALTVNIPVQMPYFNGKCSTNIGEKVHNFFPRNFEPILTEATKTYFDNKLIYKPAKVNITVNELDGDYNVLRTETISELKLYAGSRPKAFPVFTNHLVRRRVEGSTYILSYLADLVSPTLITGSSIPANTFALGDVQRVKIEDTENKIMFPSVREFLGLKYITCEGSNNLITVEWENDNLTREWMIFTGEYSFPSDFTHIYQSSVYSTLKEKFDVEEIAMININTGFILKAEIPLIKELIKSKLCFLKIGNVIYRSFALNNKIVAENSSEQLIQYELEFLIVKEYGN